MHYTMHYNMHCIMHNIIHYDMQYNMHGNMHIAGYACYRDPAGPTVAGTRGTHRHGPVPAIQVLLGFKTIETDLGWHKPSTGITKGITQAQPA